MSSNMNTNNIINQSKQIMCVSTDAGSKMDPDDELFLLWLFTGAKSEIIRNKFDINIILCGAGNESKVKTFFEGIIDFDILLQNGWDIKFHQYVKATDGSVSYPTIQNKIKYDLLINISPNIDNVLPYLEHGGMVSFMGNKTSLSEFQQLNPNCVVDGTYAFNDVGSNIFLNYLKDTNTPVFTTTSAESRKKENLISDDLFNNETVWGVGKSVPLKIQELVQKCVYKNVIGRFDPSILSASNPGLVQVPIGLVNPEIKGANYSDAKGIADLIDLDVPHDIKQTIFDASKNYMDTLNQKNIEILGKPIDDAMYRKTLDYLTELEINVYKITGQLPISDGKLITSAESNLHEKYSEGFSNFVRIGKYSPAFDLVAGRTAIEYYLSIN